jgi:hypothetical protein
MDASYGKVLEALTQFFKEYGKGNGGYTNGYIVLYTINLDGEFTCIATIAHFKDCQMVPV